VKTKIFLIISFFCCILVFFAGCGHPIDNRSSPIFQDTSTPIITNTTIFDPIIGPWIRPNEKTIQSKNITIESYGYVTKWEKNNVNLTYVRGPWTKVSENSYAVQWLVEIEWFGNYGVVREFIPTNETITYDPSTDSINASGVFFIRDNKTLKNNTR
jgi:hypothetical protein